MTCTGSCTNVTGGIQYRKFRVSLYKESCGTFSCGWVTIGSAVTVDSGGGTITFAWSPVSAGSNTKLRLYFENFGPGTNTKKGTATVS